jgi:hypothetical protein
MQILRATVLGLLALCTLTVIPAVAQNDDGVVILFSSVPAGLGHGQTLRANLVNLVEVDHPRASPAEVRAKARFLSAQGEVLIHIEAASPIPAGGIQSFDFIRDSLTAVPGEGGTGRIRSFLPTSFEITENGRTVATTDNIELVVKVLN